MDRSKETRTKAFLICLTISIIFILIYTFTSALVIDSGSSDRIGTQAKSAENQELTIASTTAEGIGSDLLSATSRGDEDRTPAAAATASAVSATETAKKSTETAAKPASTPAKTVAKTTSAPATVVAKPAAAPATSSKTASTTAPKAASTAASKADSTTAAAKPDSSNESDLDLLARLITAEAQGEPYEAQVAVGAVVMNRVKSSDWPNTVKGVIYQEIGGYYQFTPVVNGWIDKPAEPECIKAAKEAMSGADPTGGAQFYYDDKVTNEWILAKTVATQYGHMIFAY